jgi:hypothetical protein
MSPSLLIRVDLPVPDIPVKSTRFIADRVSASSRWKLVPYRAFDMAEQSRMHRTIRSIVPAERSTRFG